MTKKELEHVKSILVKIKNKDPKVDLAISYLDKDIALRQMQRKDMRDNMYPPEYDY